ncbi:MAG TPA: hypothetical protein VFQ27_06275 [Xanthobacteraceae bacterium]|nr:hypothetical protein [Xanthobacteraceae bacterium]
MLGDLVARIDQPDVAAGLLAKLDPELARRVAAHAAMASLQVPDFVAGAVRCFLDEADDDLWFQLLTIIRKAEDPSIAALQTILQWTVTPRGGGGVK